MERQMLRIASILLVFTITLFAFSHVSYGTDHYYTDGAAKILISSHGEMPKLEYPEGYEHLYTGSIYEGWSISYKVGDIDNHTYTIYKDYPYSKRPVPVSYTENKNTASELDVSVVTKTTDNILLITHRFVMDKTIPRINIYMTVKNISTGNVTDIRLKRVNDIDLDTAGTKGWAGYDNWFDLTPNGITTYTVNPPEGREAHRLYFYGLPSPTEFLVDDWDDWYQRENIIDFTEYPVYGDYTTTLSWDLGNLLPDGETFPVNAVYSMEASSAWGNSTDVANEGKRAFKTTEIVYAIGRTFTPNSTMDVYIVSDKNWKPGDAIGTYVSGGKTAVTTDSNGDFMATPVWTVPVVGNYDMVFDGNRNGVYDEGIDYIVGLNAIGFYVADEIIKKPRIGVTPSSNYDYGTLNYGQTASNIFTVTNEGDADLSVGQIAVNGTNASEFVKGPSDNVSLKVVQPKESGTFSIIFTPVSAGSKTAIITIPSNDPDHPNIEIALTGNYVEKLYEMTLMLAKGWNFISLPLQPANTSITTILGGISDNINIVWGYDNESKIWKKYKPGANDNTLDKMVSGSGYWMNLTGEASVIIPSSDESVDVHLVSGWNLVGCSPVEPTGIRTAATIMPSAGETVKKGRTPKRYVGSIKCINPEEESLSVSPFGTKVSVSWDAVWGWSEGGWAAKHSGSTINVPVLNLNKIEQGRAYWIKIK
jgi:hypothetical protein